MTQKKYLKKFYAHEIFYIDIHRGSQCTDAQLENKKKLQKEKEDRATKRAEAVKQKLKEKEQLRLKQSMKRTVMFLL